MAYTREQIYAAMRQADQAGDGEAVRALASELQRMSGGQTAPTRQETAQAANAAVQNAMGAFRSMVPGGNQASPSPPGGAAGAVAVSDLRRIAEQNPPLVPERYTRGLAQGVGSMVKGAVNNTIGIGANPLGQMLYNATGHGNQRYDAGEIARNALGLPANQSSMGDAIIGTGTGAMAMGGLFRQFANAAAPGTARNVFTTLAGDPLTNAAAGAGAGGGGQYAAEHGAGPWGQFAASLAGAMLAGGVASKFAPRPPIAPMLPRETPETVNQQVVAAGAREGVPVYTTDLKQPTTFIGKNAQAIGERIPFVGTGGMRASQQTARVQAVKNVLGDYGGDQAVNLFDNAPSAVEDIAANLSAQRAARLSALTGQKNGVIESISGNVPIDRTLTTIDEQIARLRGINETAYQPVISRLENFKNELAQGKTLTQIEGNRRLLGDMFQDPNLANLRTDGQKAINALYDPLNAEMGTYIRNQGGAEAFNRWKSANTQLAGMVGELSDSAFKRALQTTDMTPENVGKLLFSRNKSDVQRLWGNLNEFGQQRARAALLQRAFDRAVSADGGLSVERFSNNLDGLSNSIGVAFTGADNARIEGLKRLLDATRRAATASVSPPTGAQNMPMVAGYTLASLFGKAAIPVAAMGGLFARAYESAPVRNALLRLGRTAPGSVAETRALTNASRLFVPVIAREQASLGAAANSNMMHPLAATPEEQQNQPEYGVPQP